MNRPRPYDLKDPDEVKRLHAEVLGYLKTDRQAGYGTDFDGRQFAIEALEVIVKVEDEADGCVRPPRHGGHKYEPEGGTSDCEFRCGAWMGNTRSGAPDGIDPFGRCPKNPMNKD